jgi:hypothetical protein
VFAADHTPLSLAIRLPATPQNALSHPSSFRLYPSTKTALFFSSIRTRKTGRRLKYSTMFALNVLTRNIDLAKGSRGRFPDFILR